MGVPIGSRGYETVAPAFEKEREGDELVFMGGEIFSESAGLTKRFDYDI